MGPLCSCGMHKGHLGACRSKRAPKSERKDLDQEIWRLEDEMGNLNTERGTAIATIDRIDNQLEILRGKVRTLRKAREILEES